ncbi:MAG: D-alanine--poly(phosphoribitol) ligase subunit DltC [Raoultibacter sp.]
MVDSASVEATMLDMLEEICDDEAVCEQRDVDLFKVGLLDSMAAIEVLVGIQEEFGITIAPTAVPREEMNTVNKIIEQVVKRLS